jgi:hypothetical protein
MGPVTNPVFSELVALGAVNPADVVELHPRTRDADIPVYMDE